MLEFLVEFALALGFVTFFVFVVSLVQAIVNSVKIDVNITREGKDN